MSEYGREAFNELRAAEAEAERLRADLAAVIAAKGDDWQAGYETGCAMSHSIGCAAVQDHRDALLVERDALSARLQAVRDTARRLRDLAEEHLYDGDSDRPLLPGYEQAHRLADALDASLGTPGDEKPQPSEPESMVWASDGCYDSWSNDHLGAEAIVAWVNANGGEALPIV